MLPISILYIGQKDSYYDTFSACVSPTLNIDLQPIPQSKTAVDYFESDQYELCVFFHQPPHVDITTDITLSTRYGVPSLVMAPAGEEAALITAVEAGASAFMVCDDEDRYGQMLPLLINKVLQSEKLRQTTEKSLRALRHRNETLASLNRIANELASIHDVETLTHRLMRVAIDLLNVEGASVWTWADEEKDALVCRAVVDRGEAPPLVGASRDRGEGIVGWVGEHERPLVVPKTSTDPRFEPDIDTRINFVTQSIMAMPLRTRDEVSGVLEFVNKLSGEFTEEDVRLAETLTATAAVALENAHLVERMRQNTADLRERNAELDAFGHTVAHDLQNMLARMIGFAEYLQMEFEDRIFDLGEGEDVWEHSLAVIVRNGRKMASVIDALLMLSSIRHTQVKRGAVDMKPLLKEVIYRIQDRIEEKDARIEIQEEMHPAYGYGPWIEEVWYNYLSNAVRYGGESPRIHIGCNPVINDSAEEEEEMIRYWVRDWGPGVSETMRENLFTPFVAMDNTAQRDGHGLGLSIVRRIVERLGGEVGVENGEGAGSRFTFTLPRHSVSEEVE